MKLFYGIALLILAVLTLFPLILLSRDTAERHSGAMVYHVTYPADVKSIDPATCGDDISSIIQANFFEGLYAYHYLRRPVEVVPQLAADMPVVSDNGLTYTIRLKPGVLLPPQPLLRKGPDRRASVEHAGDARRRFRSRLQTDRRLPYQYGTGVGIHRGPHRGTRRLSREQPVVPYRRFFPLRPAGRGSRSGRFPHPAHSSYQALSAIHLYPCHADLRSHSARGHRLLADHRERRPWRTASASRPRAQPGDHRARRGGGHRPLPS